MMGITFTQYLRPSGRRQMVSIERPPEIERMAQAFIAAGGRYECEVLTTDDVSFTAVMDIDGEPEDVEIEVSPNDERAVAAVDALVAASVKHIPVEAAS